MSDHPTTTSGYDPFGNQLFQALISVNRGTALSSSGAEEPNGMWGLITGITPLTVE